MPWHSLQVGALASFLATSCPWMLVAYCWPISAWQDAQSTFWRDGLAGPDVRGVHPRVALAAGDLRVARARDLRAPSANELRPSLALRPGSAWQRRQSASAMPCA